MKLLKNTHTILSLLLPGTSFDVSNTIFLSVCGNQKSRYYPHFVDEQIVTELLHRFFKITQLEGERIEFQIKVT